MIKLFWIVLIGAGLIACSSVNTLEVSSSQYSVSNQFESENKLDSIISIYRDSLNEEMQITIGSASKNFEKGRPNGLLNNWAADVILNSQISLIETEVPVICILNTGGLRNPLSKGPITIGDVYKLMPFDNLIVWAKMPLSSISSIENYLTNSGGEPIAGATVVNGKLIFNEKKNESEYFWVVTSDYLLNGGDHMDFFEQRIDDNLTGLLMRDAMIEAVKTQGELEIKEEDRISFK